MRNPSLNWASDSLREACNERDGWYTTHALERIKTVLRHKFFSLLLGRMWIRVVQLPQLLCLYGRRAGSPLAGCVHLRIKQMLMLCALSID